MQRRIKKPRAAGFFYASPAQAGKAASHYLAADASAAGAAAGAATGAAGAAASSFLPQAAKAAAAITAAKTRDLFMMIFLIGVKTISGNCLNDQNGN
jgi:hypothetical protein